MGVRDELPVGWRVDAARGVGGLESVLCPLRVSDSHFSGGFWGSSSLLLSLMVTRRRQSRPRGSLGLLLMLWSSGRGYPERGGFPREEKTPAKGLVRRQTLGLAPDIQRGQSGISLTLAQSQAPAPGHPHPWEAEAGRVGSIQVQLPHHGAVGSLTRPPFLQSPH